MVKYHQVWSSIIESGQVSSSLVKYHQVWSSIIKYGQVFSRLFGALWTALAQWSETHSLVRAALFGQRRTLWSERHSLVRDALFGQSGARYLGSSWICAGKKLFICCRWGKAYIDILWNIWNGNDISSDQPVYRTIVRRHGRTTISHSLTSESCPASRCWFASEAKMDWSRMGDQMDGPY
jgi:hypothetical protein